MQNKFQLLLLSHDKPFVGMCCAVLFLRSVLRNISSKTILFNDMSLDLITISLSKHFHNFLAELLILPGQRVDSCFCPFFNWPSVPPYK